MKSILSKKRTKVVGNAVVSAARELTSDTAMMILEKGGNAVDAGVAAALVAGVIEPMETTLAGSGFMLLAEATGKVHSIEFAPRAPSKAHENMYTIDPDQSGDRGLGISKVLGDKNIQGATSAGVPATLKGLIDAHDRFGKLPLKIIMQPAIDAAQNGFEADDYYILETLDHIHALRSNEYASKIFLIDGLPPKPTHLGATTLGVPALIKQEKLAETLASISENGIDYFYKGPLGQKFIKTHQKFGGLVSEDDLAAVKTNFTTPRKLKFRDSFVWAPTSPCGALTQLQVLNVWQKIYPNLVTGPYDIDHIKNLINACWYAFADRYHWLADSDFVPTPDSAILCDEYAEYISNLIKQKTTNPFQTKTHEMPWNYFAKHAVNNPWQFEDGVNQPVWNPDSASDQTSGTTHLSVVDSDGMAVSITHTAANHFGSKVVCEYTGLLLDAAMGWFNALPNAANSIAPNKRPLANMGPLMITKDNNYVAAIGAPGGRRIICSMIQVVLNLIERNMDSEQALSAPRIDASGWKVLLSERLDSFSSDLSMSGFDNRIVKEQHQAFGYELARPVVAMKSQKECQACVDPYSQGYARSIK